MSLHPSDLRAGDWVYLAELDWLGQTIRVAESAVSGVPFGAFGASVDFAGGLDLGGSLEREIDLFSDVPSDESASASILLTGRVDVPLEISRGQDPLGSEFRVYLHPVGSGKRRQVFRGYVQEYEHGEKADPLSFTARQSIADDVGQTHPESLRYGLRTLGAQGLTWDWDNTQDGSWWPIVFGKPGSGSASVVPEEHGYGSPAFGVRQMSPSHYYAGISAYLTAALGGDVFVWNKDTGQSGNVTVSGFQAENGEDISLAIIDSFTTPKWSDEDEIWIDWGASGGGVAAANGDLIRGAGDVLHWLASRARGVALDLIQIKTAAPRLNGMLIDAAIVPGPDDVIRPWEWAIEHLFPILPISAMPGPDGVQVIVWRPDATTSDAVAGFTEGKDCVRVGDAESTSLADITNEITISYGYDFRQGKNTKRLRLTGDAVEANADADAVLDPNCVRSFGLYGKRPSAALATEVVWDAGTAFQVAQWRARRYALPSRAVLYRVAPAASWLDPGAVVTITDAGLGLSDRVALVESIAPEATGDARMVVRIYA